LVAQKHKQSASSKTKATAAGLTNVLGINQWLQRTEISTNSGRSNYGHVDNCAMRGDSDCKTEK